jgi:ribosomal protein S18 acetylase RimI-like enzyme
MISCKTSSLDDLPAIARCHAQAFPTALAVKHGARFTQRMLEWYIVSERGEMFHIEDGDEVAAYCGAIRIHQPGLPGAFTSISQHAFHYFVISYLQRPWLFFHRENLKKLPGIVRNVKMKLTGKPQPAVSATQAARFTPSWGLVVIGANPAHQGKGYGSALLQEFERRAREDKVDKVHLSVHPDNQTAIASYQRNGWKADTITENSMSMVKDISETSSEKALDTPQT